MAVERPVSRNDTFAGLPWWARVIAMVGIPGSIAFFAVWTGAQFLPAIQAELVSIRLEAERSRHLFEQSVAQVEENHRLLQRICSIIAKTDEERARCFDR